MTRYCWVVKKNCDAPVPCFYECENHNQTEKGEKRIDTIIESLRKFKEING